MKVLLRRLTSDNIETIGFFNLNDKPECFSLEDAYHAEKIPGKTRIPAGTYEIKLRNEGGMTKDYEERYGKEFHKGMLWLQDVPNFTWVYIHTGNKAKDTEGCILTGNSANLSEDEKSVGASRTAYRKLYPQIANAILSGEKVFITIEDEWFSTGG